MHPDLEGKEFELTKPGQKIAIGKHPQKVHIFIGKYLFF